MTKIRETLSVKQLAAKFLSVKNVTQQMLRVYYHDYIYLWI